MNRTLKNVLMGVILVFLGISIYWTATYQQEQAMDFRKNGQVQEIQQGNKNKREKVLESGDESSSSEKEDSGAMQTSLPPDMNQNGELHERPMDDRMPQERNMPELEHVKNHYQYITLGMEVVFFSIISIYLILSKGNLKSFKEVFVSSKEVGIFSLLSILLSVFFYYGIVFLSPL